MFKNLLNKKTSKFDVIMAATAALVAVWKAVDTVKEYQIDNSTKENNQ